MDLGNEILIADTIGFIEAPGIGEYLAKQGRAVQIVTFHPNIALELRGMNHWDHLMPRVISSGIRIHYSTWVKKISGQSVTLYSVFLKSQESVVHADNVVLITGRTQNDDLYSIFKAKVRQVHLIGDANIGGARIGNAIYDGQKIAREF